MNLYHQAIQEAHLWTAGPTAKRSILVQHPNGVKLSGKMGTPEWTITQRGAQPDAAGRTHWRQVRIPRESGRTDLDGLREDTLRVAGPEPRARLHQLLEAIQAWVLGIPDHGDTLCLVRRDGRVLLKGSILEAALPEALHARLRALDHVLYSSDASPWMTDSGEIWIDLPTTAHAALDLRARVRACPDA